MESEEKAMTYFKKATAILCLILCFCPGLMRSVPASADTSTKDLVSFLDQSLSAKGVQGQNVSKENKEHAIQFMKDHQVPEATIKAFIAADPSQALQIQWTASGMAGDNAAVLKMVESYLNHPTDVIGPDHKSDIIGFHGNAGIRSDGSETPPIPHFHEAVTNKEDISPASTDVHLTVDGHPVATNASDGQPYVTKSGRTMVPLRLVAEHLGVRVDYSNGHITLSQPLCGYLAAFQVNQRPYMVNRQKKVMDVAPVISPEGRTYVSLRAVGESLGKVQWQNDTRTVAVTTQLQPTRTHTKFPLSDNVTYELANGNGLAHFTDVYLLRFFPKDRSGSYLPFPEPYNSRYKAAGIDKLTLYQAVSTSKGALIAVEGPESEGNTLSLFYDDLSQNEPKAVTFAGTIKRTTAVASDDTWLFSTDGVLYMSDTNPLALHIRNLKSGSEGTVVLDLPLNDAALAVVGDALKITRVDGSAENLPISELVQKAGLKA